MSHSKQEIIEHAERTLADLDAFVQNTHTPVGLIETGRIGNAVGTIRALLDLLDRSSFEDEL